MRHARGGRRQLHYGVPYFLLPDRLLPGYVRSLAGLAGATPREVRGELALARLERARFIERTDGVTGARIVLLAERHMAAARGREPPFDTLGPSDAGELLESLIHDARQRGVSYGFVADGAEEAPEDLAPFRPYEQVTAIEGRLVVKRLAASLTRLLYEVGGDAR